MKDIFNRENVVIISPAGCRLDKSRDAKQILNWKNKDLSIRLIEHGINLSSILDPLSTNNNQKKIRLRSNPAFHVVTFFFSTLQPLTVCNKATRAVFTAVIIQLPFPIRPAICICK